MEGKAFNIGFSIEKVDAERRQVSGYATVEEPDRQGDIVDYGASINAFQAWPGNIREQHRKDKAVGVCVNWEPVPERKAIWVTTQISKSRDGEDTWTKIQEGVLKGFSIGGVALDQKPEIIKGRDKPLNRITKYRLDELSIVDNPACPSAAIHLVKSVDGVSMPTDVVEKVTVSTSGNEPMAVDYGSDSGASGQHGQTPPAPGQVQTDAGTGESEPTTEDTDNDSDPTTAADANLDATGPSMPTPETAKPNGLMDQRGKTIKSMSAEDLLKSMDGLTPAQVGAAVMKHLQEFRAPAEPVRKSEPVLTDTPIAEVSDVPHATEITKVLADFRANLLGEVTALLKGERPETDTDSDRTNDTKNGENAGDGTSGADGQQDPDHDGDDDSDPVKDTDAAKTVDAPMQKVLVADDVRSISKTVAIAATTELVQTATGNLEKTLVGSLEKALGDFEARLTKAVDEKFSALEGRMQRVEAMPGYPEMAPAVRAVDKSLGEIPGTQGLRPALSNELAKRVRDDKRAPADLREEAGRMLALEDMHKIFGR